MAVLEWCRLRKGMQGGLDISGMVQPLCHIGGLVVNLLAQLVLGVTNIMIATPRFDPRAALDAVEQELCTVLDGVPRCAPVISSGRASL